MSEFSSDFKESLKIDGTRVDFVSLESFESKGPIVDGGISISNLPYSAKILLESTIRQCDGRTVTQEHIESIPRFVSGGGEVSFKPARVIMQDFTGVPGIVDLAAMRDSLTDLGGDPTRINPLIPVDLVIDHSVQVDQFGSKYALMHNTEREFERNRERYEFLHWAAESFENFTVVPPATGIVHQVNLEYLAKVVRLDADGMALPDTLVGTDSHTTMINGLGVLGWGVGGIEAEAALLGQPLYIRMPEIVGVHVHGKLPFTVTATDLVLRVTELLRDIGVVGKLVEFYGDGLDELSLPDRATISNMCPEYGATAAFFPVDSTTLSYLRTTGRDEATVALVESYTKAQGMFRNGGAESLEWSQSVELDLASIDPSVSGPKRPQDRLPLAEAGRKFQGFASEIRDGGEPVRASFSREGRSHEIADGAVVIAAITSCTNTSNPQVMVAAGLLAKRAVELGMKVPAHVKTSLAPGSRVVTRYLEQADLSQYLDELGFNLVGYGCTTCIGNSGPLPEDVSKAVQDSDLLAVSVLSGNRNFEGRIHPEVRANYLASPPLVVAYALAGRFDIDIEHDSIGTDASGNEVHLRDLWPTPIEVAKIVAEGVGPDLFREEYGNVYTGNAAWNEVTSSSGDMYQWDAGSTYIKRPPFFEGLSREPEPPGSIEGARVLALLGDSVTTDHISPAGMISRTSPAAGWLKERNIEESEFNSYGSRRGNHEIMMRGTFANIRIRNQLNPEVEGGFTRHMPSGEVLPIFDAANRYAEEGVPLVVLAGKEYGMGSSRDWAAKGVSLLGVKAAIAQTFERIHRSNLIGMGVLPLQFEDAEGAESLGLSGQELFFIPRITRAREKIEVTAKAPDGGESKFTCIARIDTDVDLDYYRNGGILHTVLREMAG